MRSFKNREVLFLGIVFCLWAALTPTRRYAKSRIAVRPMDQR